MQFFTTMCRPFANTWWKAWKGWPLFQVDAPTLKNGFGDRSILWCKFLGITLLQLHIRIFNPCGVETLLSVFWFVRIFCPFRSVVVLSATFLRSFLRKEQKYPVKRTSKCPLINKDRLERICSNPNHPKSAKIRVMTFGLYLYLSLMTFSAFYGENTLKQYKILF